MKSCSHCGGELRGFASAWQSGEPERFLCHPDTGLDCYRLVTVYQHPMHCKPCGHVRTLEDEARDDDQQAN
jgi:hypothetical protein